ncbi:hypothetical protein BDN70DRAFT_235897 [Pholiota conissans]|uniref:Uncharacterized protein n=1 Tax=Pholiota conissans TaxID=109636 RepID=A0A9P5ZET5_9AGAR|nr:hypothetical protein BDN70DRAFT_235897 [Pholiota conissans]
MRQRAFGRRFFRGSRGIISFNAGFNAGMVGGAGMVALKPSLQAPRNIAMAMAFMAGSIGYSVVSPILNDLVGRQGISSKSQDRPGPFVVANSPKPSQVILLEDAGSLQHGLDTPLAVVYAPSGKTGGKVPRAGGSRQGGSSSSSSSSGSNRGRRPTSNNGQGNSQDNGHGANGDGSTPPEEGPRRSARIQGSRKDYTEQLGMRTGHGKRNNGPSPPPPPPPGDTGTVPGIDGDSHGDTRSFSWLALAFVLAAAFFGYAFVRYFHTSSDYKDVRIKKDKKGASPVPNHVSSCSTSSSRNDTVCTCIPLPAGDGEAVMWHQPDHLAQQLSNDFHLLATDRSRTVITEKGDGVYCDGIYFISPPMNTLDGPVNSMDNLPNAMDSLTPQVYPSSTTSSYLDELLLYGFAMLLFAKVMSYFVQAIRRIGLVDDIPVVQKSSVDLPLHTEIFDESGPDSHSPIQSEGGDDFGNGSASDVGISDTHALVVEAPISEHDISEHAVKVDDDNFRKHDTDEDHKLDTNTDIIDTDNIHETIRFDANTDNVNTVDTDEEDEVEDFVYPGSDTDNTEAVADSTDIALDQDDSEVFVYPVDVAVTDGATAAADNNSNEIVAHHISVNSESQVIVSGSDVPGEVMGKEVSASADIADSQGYSGSKEIKENGLSASIHAPTSSFTLDNGTTSIPSLSGRWTSGISASMHAPKSSSIAGTPSFTARQPATYGINVFIYASTSSSVQRSRVQQTHDVASSLHAPKFVVDTSASYSAGKPREPRRPHVRKRIRRPKTTTVSEKVVNNAFESQTPVSESGDPGLKDVQQAKTRRHNRRPKFHNRGKKRQAAMDLKASTGGEDVQQEDDNRASPPASSSFYVVDRGTEKTSGIMLHQERYPEEDGGSRLFSCGSTSSSPAPVDAPPPAQHRSSSLSAAPDPHAIPKKIHLHKQQRRKLWLSTQSAVEQSSSSAV